MTSYSVTKKSFAKLNLFLHIVGKRADGYHNLQTVFRLIDFYDTLIFKNTKQSIENNCPIILRNSCHVTDNDEKNLIVKASRALLAYVQQNQLKDIQLLPQIEVELQKNIPMGAGLGGGSSNCATTLVMLNQLWQLNLTNEILQKIGASLGADVPIFIYHQDAIAEGIGEILTPIDLPPQQYLLLTPQAHISTAELFSHPKLFRQCSVFTHQYLQDNHDNFIEILTRDFSNVFQPVVRELSKEVDIALSYLESLAVFTKTTPRMTGSGSSVFLPLPLNYRIDDEVLRQWQLQAPCLAYITYSMKNK